ncbi:hypothetical protein BJ742DRAFT_20870 [Cladochytrium replicatum]|nr:hypothetical protein BJ742DRAFT_20870 [Cladochytrium replicatum]
MGRVGMRGVKWVSAATDPAVQAEAVEGAAAAEGAEASLAAEAAAEKEPEEVLKTYEQYQAELAAKRASLASVNVRKANEGADDGQWKDAVPLAREEEEEEFFSGKTKSKKATPAKEKQSKGRGRGEGPGDNRGRGRGPRQNVVNVGDESAFPSLGAK